MDLEQSLLWPPSLVGFGPGAPIGVLLLSGLVVASLSLVVRQTRARPSRLLVLAIPGVGIVPLLAAYQSGPHHQIVLVFLAIAASVPVGRWLVGIRHEIARSTVLAALVLVPFLGLAVQWTQTRPSHAFRRLTAHDTMRLHNDRPTTVCRKNVCPEFMAALREVQRLVLRLESPPERSELWRGVCVSGINPSNTRFPYRLLIRSRSGANRTRVPLWEFGLQWLRWPRAVEPMSAGNRALPLLSRSVGDDTRVKPEDRCRWLLAFAPIGPGEWAETVRRRVGRDLRRWQGWWSRGRTERVASRSIGGEMVMSAWRARHDGR